MMSAPKFSIILPTYNRNNMLQRAVQSVLMQSYDNWELVIVDDGSTDSTADFFKQLDHEQIVYKYQENKGRSSARNLGLNISSGSYICFLDSDDELLPNYLDDFRELIKKNEKEIYLTGVRLQNGNDYKTYLPKMEQENYILQCLEGMFNLMPFCFHKSKINNNPFQTDLYYGEDFHFLIPTILKHNVTVKPVDNCIVHQHSERTINRVFLEVRESYLQFEKSILNTIDDNIESIRLIISKNELKMLRIRKVHDFILTAAKYNLGFAKEINNRQKENKISSTTLAAQKIKGIIQSWIT